MSWIDYLSAFIAFALLGYLLYALLYAETLP
ncbi:MAG: potassium-transporting ATPase subunit F [Pseudomonadota bacterium]